MSRCPALWFAYILMPGKKEWVLVQLGSQQKCVERPVRPVFTDQLSVSCDYGYMACYMGMFVLPVKNFTGKINPALILPVRLKFYK